MHESSLAREFLQAAVARAEREGARRIVRVSGWIAETETLSRASLALHFEGLARGTIAEGARLELRLVHVEARCRACDQVFSPEHHLLVCPACDGTDAELLGSTGLGIDVLEVEDP